MRKYKKFLDEYYEVDSNYHKIFLFPLFFSPKVKRLSVYTSKNNSSRRNSRDGRLDISALGLKQSNLNMKRDPNNLQSIPKYTNITSLADIQEEGKPSFLSTRVNDTTISTSF